MRRCDVGERARQVGGELWRGVGGERRVFSGRE